MKDYTTSQGVLLNHVHKPYLNYYSSYFSNGRYNAANVLRNMDFVRFPLHKVNPHRTAIREKKYK